jgi:predicted GTPase
MGAAGRDFHSYDVRFRESPTQQIGPVLPAMGYRPQQVKELEDTINATPCDLDMAATPLDLRRVLRINKSCERVRYELQETGQPTLANLLGESLT